MFVCKCNEWLSFGLAFEEFYVRACVLMCEWECGGLFAAELADGMVGVGGGY